MQAVLVVMPVFILITAGWILQQKKYLSPQTLKENSFFLYWFAMPATLLRGILSADANIVQSASFLIAIWAPYVITLVIAWTTWRNKNTSGRFPEGIICSVRGNNFFAGIPIVSLAMGQRGVEAATLMLAFSMVVIQMLSIGGAQLALFGTISWKTVRNTCVQLLKNPLFLTCLFGLLLVFTGANHLPEWLDSTLGILADVSTGLALIGLGAGIRLQNILKTAVSLWKILLFKLAVLPAVAYIVFTFFGFSQDMIQAGVLLAGMPVAVNTAIVAGEMGMDGEYCAMGITITTLFSLLTIPLLIRLLGIA